MKNLLILLGILLSSPFVVAQHSAINGNVAIANNSPEGTRVVVIKNGNKLDEQVLNKKGHFDSPSMPTTKFLSKKQVISPKLSASTPKYRKKALKTTPIFLPSS